MAKPPSSEKYFWGRITREEAQEHIRNAGRRDGMFLLRESLSAQGNYAISLCFKNSIHHYNIVKQPDGKYKIDRGRKFIGPVEIVEHHRRHLDGFLTLPSIPVNRSESQSPLAFRDLTSRQLDYLLLQKARDVGMGVESAEKLLPSHREKLLKRTCKDLHKKMAWFHFNLSRDEADVLVQRVGHADGKFLIREKDQNNYALTLSFENETKHYRIDWLEFCNQLAIPDGPKFDNLMELVDHYHNKPDGLLCVLRVAIPRPGYRMEIPSEGKVLKSSGKDRKGTSSVGHSGSSVPRPSSAGRSGYVTSGASAPTQYDHDDDGALWDQPDDEQPIARLPDAVISESDDRQQIYNEIPFMTEIEPRNLELTDTLGAGNFGSVRMGYYSKGGKKVAVAVKTLKDETAASLADFEKEAHLMLRLRHPNIVRLIGMCHGAMLMLVLELAPLGPLNKYMKKPEGRALRFGQLLHLMTEVCKGMCYLESKSFVHRDLAARNVLLVTEDLPKISDFGMSRALNYGSDTYQAQQSGKWPLKWYAPECLYFWKFDSKSDVWSYGVTCWETYSRGQRPYQGMKGQVLLDYLGEGNRLSKPADCPDDVFRVLQLCWKHHSAERPSFSELLEKMKRLEVRYR